MEQFAEPYRTNGFWTSVSGFCGFISGSANLYAVQTLQCCCATGASHESRSIFVRSIRNPEPRLRMCHYILPICGVCAGDQRSRTMPCGGVGVGVRFAEGVWSTKIEGMERSVPFTARTWVHLVGMTTLGSSLVCGMCLLWSKRT